MMASLAFGLQPLKLCQFCINNDCEQCTTMAYDSMCINQDKEEFNGFNSNHTDMTESDSDDGLHELNQEQKLEKSVPHIQSDSELLYAAGLTNPSCHLDTVGQNFNQILLRLHAEITTLTKANIKMCEDLNERQMKFNKIISEKNRERALRKNDFMMLKDRLDQFIEHSAYLKDQLDKECKARQSVQEENTNMMEKYAKLHEDFIANKEEQEQRQAEFNEIQSQHRLRVSTLTKELKLQQSKYKKLKVAFDEKEKETNSLSQQKKALQTKNYSLNSKYTKVESDFNALNEKYRKKKIKYDNLKKEQKELQTKYKEMETKYTRTQTDLDNLNLKYGAESKALNASEKRWNSLQFKYEKIRELVKNMEQRHQELQQKYNAQLNKFGYVDWSSKDIADWIVSIDKVKYYKYYDDLLTNLSKEGIDGQCLYELDKNDLYRLGIVSFKDKNNIFMAIRRLIANGKGKNDDNRIEIVREEKAMELKYNELKIQSDLMKEKHIEAMDEFKKQLSEALNQKECVICLDKGKTHCCVPCGHLCLCDDCEGVKGQCPICQTKYYSLQRIYS